MSNAKTFRSYHLLLLLVAAVFLLVTGDLAVAALSDDDDVDEHFPEPSVWNCARTFDVMLFGSTDPAARELARAKLIMILQAKIDSIDRISGLTSAQREKLFLAGRGDIHRFLIRADDQRKKCELLTYDAAKIRMKALFVVRDSKYDAMMQRLRQETYPLQAALAAGPYGDGAIFSKCLPATLNADQYARYGAIREVERAGGQYRVGTGGADEAYEIRLTGTPFTDAGLARLRWLTNIRSLILDATQVTDAGLSHLKEAHSLEVLDLGRTLVSSKGLVYLKELTNLQRLDLKSTQIDDTGLANLKGLTRLTYVYLYGTHVTDSGMAHLKSLKSLESLYLGSTYLSDAGIAELTDLKNLRELTLNDSRVSDAGLSHLSRMRRLEMLDLRNTDITDAGIADLRTLTSLQYLAVDGTRITDAGIAELRQALPALKVDR